MVKSFDFAQAKPGEDLGLGGRLGAVNVGAKGDLTLQVEELKTLNQLQLEDAKKLSQVDELKKLNSQANAG